MIAAYTQRIMDDLSQRGSATVFVDTIPNALNDSHGIGIARTRLHNAAWRAGLRIQTRTAADPIRGHYVHATVVTTSRKEDANSLRALVDRYREALEFSGLETEEAEEELGRYYQAIDRLERS